MESDQGAEANRSHQLQVLLACSIGAAFGYGTLGVALFGQFVEPLAEKLGRPSADIGFAFSVMTFGSVLGPPIAGKLIDRFGTRPVVFASACLMGACFFLLAAATELWAIYALYGLVALMGSGTLVVAYSRPIVGSFVRHRGMALGVMLATVGAVTIVLPLLVVRVIDNVSLESAYRMLGIVAVLMVLPAAWLLKPQLESRRRPTLYIPSAASAWRFVGTRSGLVLLATAFVLGIFTSGVWGQVVPLLGEKGVSRADAASAMAGMAIVLTLTRLVAGAAMDKMFAPTLGTILLAPVTVAWIVLALSDSGMLAFAMVLVLGVGVGIEFDLFSYLTSKYIPHASYAGFYGILYSAVSLGMASGHPLVVLAQQAYGDQPVAPIVMAAATGTALLLMLALPQYPPDSTMASQSILK